MTHKPTDETRKMVEAAAGVGLAHNTIATLIGITDKTLRRRYRKELNEGVAKAHFNVGKTTYERAIAGDRTLLIWYEKTRMGMRETVQVTTPPGEPFFGVEGEPELIGAYYERLKRIAAERRPDTRAHSGVGENRQGPDGPEGGPGPDPGGSLLPPR